MTDSEFLDCIRRNPINVTILERLPALALTDVWLVSGSLFQTVWNVRIGRAVDFGIKDYDVFYFDPDTSGEAEDAAIRRAADLFAGTGLTIELRNQARVHLWYEKKFGTPYPALRRATDGIDRFLSHNSQVGIAADGANTAIYAPHGFNDIADFTVRPNRAANFHSDLYMKKALRWQERWPELTILPA